jgi:hypothetical protein
VQTSLLHAWNRLDRLGTIARNSPQPKRAIECYSCSTVFVSIDGINFRGNYRLSRQLHLWPWEVNSLALVRERTIPTDRPLVGEISANSYG